MTDLVTEESIFKTADRLLMAGIQPTVEVIAQSLDAQLEDVESFLQAWWSQVPERLSLPEANMTIPEVPEPLVKSFSVIWQQAVQEAKSVQVQEQQHQAIGDDEAKREADETLNESKARLIDLEDRYRDQQLKNEDLFSQIKGLEAEIKILKTNLASETTQRKKEEQDRQNLDHELNHLRKAHDDSKRAFDQRIKDEQRHTLDAVSKADADVRYYRGALEKLRDEVGKKESALTKTIHDLQAELARKDAKTEAQRTQIKSLEGEIKNMKLNTSGQSRELSNVNKQLLVESNKNNRLEGKVKELEEEVKRARQKQVSISTEQSRRESNVRNQYKEKEEELVRALAKISTLEKRIITQDEEVRRLNSRL